MIGLERYFEIPYLGGGRSVKGVDCYGLVCLFYKDVFKIELDLFEGLDGALEVDGSDRGIMRVWSDRIVSEWVLVEAENARFGDVLDLRVLGRPHCGVWLEPEKMMHAKHGFGVSIASTARGAYGRITKGIYRHWTKI